MNGIGEGLPILDGALFRDKKVLSERPLLISPLGFAAEAGVARHAGNFFERIFVAAFGPDGFAFAELDQKFGCGDADGLLLF